MRCLKPPAMIILALALFGFLGACEGSLVADPAKGATETAKLHTSDISDIALLSVDFEPPLQSDGSLQQGKPISLLVAVDNRGDAVHRDILIEVKLTGSDGNDELATQRQTLEALAPGEVRIVRFAQLSSLPVRNQFYLQIALRRPSDEAQVDDHRVIVFRPVAPIR